MDRRAFMMTGAWLSSAAGAAWPWLVHAAARPDTLAVIDPTLANSPAFANYVAQMKLPVFETGDDIGVLWYTTLAPRLRQTPAQSCASLIGLTRASDYFVLRELATRAGHMVEHSSEWVERGERPVAHVAFALTPRLVRLR
ncbi:hypothetical protein [Paraburkholderia fungorum]|uniref:Uncharacterized protein n=1 Tax=Paraburkholderia fungorum TaxID=134537 RepID=A0A3R7E8C5_9BURK|nr:hypothetical protein [Paraburkholderia fungorum]RKF48389.1 hypothetical protein BCY88_21975 [Paraburkholderia fungorum]